MDAFACNLPSARTIRACRDGGKTDEVGQGDGGRNWRKGLTHLGFPAK